jgi:hypothetical protein
MSKPTDVFYVIGYTNDQVAEGGINSIMSLSGLLMNNNLAVALQSRFAVVPATRFVAMTRRLEPTQVLQQ